MLGRFRPSLHTSGPASPAADPRSIDLLTARVGTVRCATPSLSLLREVMPDVIAIGCSVYRVLSLTGLDDRPHTCRPRVVEFLADPESGDITGQDYSVDGGLHL